MCLIPVVSDLAERLRAEYLPQQVEVSIAQQRGPHLRLELENTHTRHITATAASAISSASSAFSCAATSFISFSPAAAAEGNSSPNSIAPPPPLPI